MPDDSLNIQNVIKRRGRVQTINDVSLQVQRGERVALLGHNGAGKTTLIRMILGLTRVDGGRINVFGAAPGSAQARAATAYLPEAVAFHKSLTGREQLTMFARLQGEPAARVGPLLERVGLGEPADRRIGTWSKGMRQRLGLAQVLLGRPKVALLDEPTSGLDPISRHEFYAILDDLVAQGTAVLVSSHALTELEARTDRIVILSKGHLVARNALAELRRQAGLPIRIRVTTAGDTADTINHRLGGQRVNCCGIELSCAPDQKMQMLGRIMALGSDVDDIEVMPPSLEDLYRHFATGGPTQ